MLTAVIAFNRRLQTGIGHEELRQFESLLDRLAANVGGSSLERGTLIGS
jgi:hypothetical protein